MTAAHRNVWIQKSEGPFKPCADYGMRIWAPLDEERDIEVRGGWEGRVVMRKP